MNFGIKTIVWYDRSIRLWTAVRQDSEGNQIGYAGYGTSKREAMLDVRAQSNDSIDFEESNI